MIESEPSRRKPKSSRDPAAPKVKQKVPKKWIYSYKRGVEAPLGMARHMKFSSHSLFTSKEEQNQDTLK